MRIAAETTKMMNLSDDLLELSRCLRSMLENVEEVRCALLPISELNEVMHSLREQNESLATLSAHAVSLSIGLREAAAIYVRAERKNEERLESEGPQPQEAIFHAISLSSQNELRRRMHTILYHKGGKEEYGTARD